MPLGVGLETRFSLASSKTPAKTPDFRAAILETLPRLKYKYLIINNNSNIGGRRQESGTLLALGISGTSPFVGFFKHRLYKCL